MGELLDQFGDHITRIPSPNPPQSGPKLVIGIVHGTNLDGWFFHSMMALLTDLMPKPGAEWNGMALPLQEVICVRSGPALQLGRGVLGNTFLERTDADVLLMLDSDMYFSSQTIYAMWEIFQNLPKDNGDKAKVLGGLAFIASAPHIDHIGLMQPNIWAPSPDGSDRFVAVRDYPRNTLVKVAATGAACLMVHREVLETVGKAQGVNGRWFYHHHLPDGDELGEDLSFCHRINEAGYGMYMHTGLLFEHAKSILLGETDYIELSEKYVREMTPAVVSDIESVGADAPEGVPV